MILTHRLLVPNRFTGPLTSTNSNVNSEPIRPPIPSFPPEKVQSSHRSSKKATADKSLLYDEQMKQLLQRIEAVEIKQKIQDKAVPHMSQMFENIETLKKKEAETSVLITKILAGQALSPVEAKAITDAQMNTTKVRAPMLFGTVVQGLTAQFFRT
jgi:hypothetical protein